MPYQLRMKNDRNRKAAVVEIHILNL